MEKTLRYLGLAAVIGAVGIICAQGAVRVRSGGTAPAGQGAQAVAAARHANNSVVQMLQSYFSNKQSLEIEKAEAAGRSDRVQPIIQASCAAFLTTLTPPQQKVEIEQVWQLSKWRPGDKDWAAVTKTPTLINHLLKIEKAVLDKVEAFTDRQWQEFTKPMDEIDRKMMATAEWKNASQQKRNEMSYEVHNKPLLQIPAVKRWQAAVDRSKAAIDFALPLLSAVERDEFNLIKTRFDVALKAAANGQEPPE